MSPLKAKQIYDRVQEIQNEEKTKYETKFAKIRKRILDKRSQLGNILEMIKKYESEKHVVKVMNI